jgi:hypothetical protein
MPKKAEPKSPRAVKTRRSARSFMMRMGEGEH